MREQKRIALGTIAEQTKIKLSLLEALERDDVAQWPRGIFGRSHLRAYAHAVGLDPDTVVAEFLEIHPDPDEEIPAILEAAQRGGVESADRPLGTRVRSLFDSAIDAVQGFRHPRESSREEIAAAVPSDEARDQPTTTTLEAELTSLARLCGRIGRAQELRDVVPVLEDALRLIDAVGLVLWLGDRDSGALTPVLAVGYSKTVIARLPMVARDADNAIAAAVRSAETKIVAGSEVKTGAVAVPVVTAAGCVGALAVEVQSPGEHRAFVSAVASILAAQLTGLVAIQRNLSGKA